MMSLLWYYRPEHLQGGRSPSMHEVSCLAGEGAEQEVVALKDGIGREQLGDSQVSGVEPLPNTVPICVPKGNNDT